LRVLKARFDPRFETCFLKLFRKERHDTASMENM